MKGKNEIKIAWIIWHWITELNDKIWTRYENEFIDLILQDEDLKYLQKRNKQ